MYMLRQDIVNSPKKTLKLSPQLISKLTARLIVEEILPHRASLQRPREVVVLSPFLAFLFLFAFFSSQHSKKLLPKSLLNTNPRNRDSEYLYQGIVFEKIVWKRSKTNGLQQPSIITANKQKSENSKVKRDLSENTVKVRYQFSQKNHKSVFTKKLLWLIQMNKIIDKNCP